MELTPIERLMLSLGSARKDEHALVQCIRNLEDQSAKKTLYEALRNNASRIDDLQHSLDVLTAATLGIPLEQLRKRQKDSH